MNAFGVDINLLEPHEAGEVLSGCRFERLPGVPPFLSIQDCAAVLGVSMKAVNRLIESGGLPLTDIPGGSLPSPGLFGPPAEPPREKCVLRADLIDFMDKALICNKAVLGPERDR